MLQSDAFLQARNFTVLMAIPPSFEIYYLYSWVTAKDSHEERYHFSKHNAAQINKDICGRIEGPRTGANKLLPVDRLPVL